MSEPLEIHVNRTRPNVLEVPDMHVTDRDFAIEVVNGGKPAHVHLNVDDDLLAILDVETGNHFVPRENTLRFPVQVGEGRRPVRGKLKVSTGYGSESRFIELRVTERSDDDQVTVDETLAEPSDRSRDPDVASSLVGDLGAVGAVAAAVVVLLAAAALVGSITSPILGVGTLLAGLLVVLAVYVLL